MTRRRPTITPSQLANLPGATSLGINLDALGLAKTNRRRKSTAQPSKSLSLIPVGDPGSWTVDLPGWHPPSLNHHIGGNIHAAQRIKTAAYPIVAGACLQAGVTKAQGKRSVAVTLIYPNRRHWMDRDNCSKALLDALVTCGALVDDAPAWLDAVPAVYEVGLMGTRLEIRDL